MGVMSVA